MRVGNVVSRVCRTASNLLSGRTTLRGYLRSHLGPHIHLHVPLTDAAAAVTWPLVVDSRDEAYHRNYVYFGEQVSARAGARVLEIGSRGARPHAGLVGHREYVGLDIHPGPNVDVVGDVHELSSLVEGPFDAIYTVSTFEHLAMPWKVVLEINRVAAPGALLLIQTHHTWPPHELPWDFWRFSASGFAALLNEHTGWELLRCDESFPAVIVPLAREAAMKDMQRYVVPLCVSALARKVGDPDPGLAWNLNAADVTPTMYPRAS